ncbi:MAG: HRDC domain-containing protein, partial [Gammaproteobacteria bacterium]|nr:HRDC domain-containing protein [Gammaproteobacteria bacterium]
WRDLYRQLIARGLLAVDLEGHGGLNLTEESRPVLRGEQPLHLRKFSRKGKAKSRERKSNRFADKGQGKLWEALRSRRQQLADEQGIPAYMIFHDATLAEMVENRPETLDQLSNISGVGERKLEAYGEPFLDLLNEYRNFEDDSQSDTEEETLQLFRLGMDVAAIATQRDLKPTTVYSHLAKGIALGEVPLKEVVQLEDYQLESIRNAIEYNDGGKRLKPVFESLEGEFPYEILRCVRADMAG